ncbi:MAG TPA: hypothetical protein VNM89_02910 [Solirubrobacterales bacterium]|nr:hypothetical protein [Solirubrobacterales bacterium]
MEGTERDSTQDWVLPEAARPPLLGELEARIDEALVTARASEAAAMVVGEAALEAAEQARRAAGLAERAAVTALDAQRRVAVSIDGEESVARRPGADYPDERLRDFADRADRIARRLSELSPATVGAGPPRSAR